MPTRMFRDWRMALLWAVGLMASVAAFFSDGGGHEALTQQAREIANKRSGQLEKAQALAANPAATRRPPPVGDERVSDDEFADEAELQEPDSEPSEPSEEASPAATGESLSAAQPAQPMQP